HAEPEIERDHDDGQPRRDEAATERLPLGPQQVVREKNGREAEGHLLGQERREEDEERKSDEGLLAARAGPLSALQVAEQRAHVEQASENVGAARNPGDALNVARMD